MDFAPLVARDLRRQVIDMFAGTDDSGQIFGVVLIYDVEPITRLRFMALHRLLWLRRHLQLELGLTLCDSTWVGVRVAQVVQLVAWF